jgi:hypothetical protein
MDTIIVSAIVSILTTLLGNYYFQIYLARRKEYLDFGRAFGALLDAYLPPNGVTQNIQDEYVKQELSIRLVGSKKLIKFLDKLRYDCQFTLTDRIFQEGWSFEGRRHNKLGRYFSKTNFESLTKIISDDLITPEFILNMSES